MKSKLFRCLLLLGITVLFAGSALAQAPAAPPAAAPAKIIIHAGHMLDVKTGKMAGESAIVISGDKIESAGPWRAQTAGKVIDLSRATVLPGLIDCHTHLTYDPNFGYQQLGISEARQTLIGAKNARNTLLAAVPPGR